MYDLRICSRRWAMLALGALILTAGQPALAQTGLPTTVMAGSDYLATLPGTFVTLPNIGVVPLVGVPIGPGNTDTIVQRQRDTDITSGQGTTPIQVTALSLASAAPVNVGGSFFDVFVTLDPGHASTGTGTIMGNASGGTFSSFFDVFFDAHFTPVGGGMGTDVFGDFVLNNSGTPWSSTPMPGEVLVNGPFGDVTANHHTSQVPPGEVDFFPVGPLVDSSSTSDETHITTAATTPEPSAIAVGIIGLVTGGMFARRRKHRA